MSIEKVRKYLQQFGKEDRIIETAQSSATVIEAAHALGCEPAHIAKSMAFMLKTGPILIIAAGDVKIDNHKFKEEFGEKAHMIAPAEVESIIGHAPGGVCPFAVNEGVRVFLDESLKRFEIVFPAAGNAASAVRLTIPELEETSQYEKWVDVTKMME